MSLARRVKALLAERPRLTQAEIKEALGVESLSCCMTRLQDRGEIRGVAVERHGRYGPRTVKAFELVFAPERLDNPLDELRP